MDEADKILTKASKLIRTRGLCRHAFAKDKNGVGVEFFDEKAYTFCALGAIYNICNRNNALSNKAIDKLRDLVKTSITNWSDASSTNKVADALLKARTSLRKK